MSCPIVITSQGFNVRDTAVEVQRPDTDSWVPFSKFGNAADVGSIAWLNKVTEPGDLVRIRFRLPNGKMFYTSLDPRRCKPSDSGLPGTAELDLARASMDAADFAMLASVSLSSLSYGDSNAAAHAERAAAALRFSPSGFYEIMAGTDISSQAVLVKNLVHMSIHERTALLAFLDDNPRLVVLLQDRLTSTPLRAVEDLVSVDAGALSWLTGEVARRCPVEYDERGFDRRGFNHEGIHKDTGTTYNHEGFDRDGIHKDTGTTYNHEGFDRNGKYDSRHAGRTSRAAVQGSIVYSNFGDNARVYPLGGGEPGRTSGWLGSERSGEIVTDLMGLDLDQLGAIYEDFGVPRQEVEVVAKLRHLHVTPADIETWRTEVPDLPISAIIVFEETKETDAFEYMVAARILKQGGLIPKDSAWEVVTGAIIECREAGIRSDRLGYLVAQMTEGSPNDTGIRVRNVKELLWLERNVKDLPSMAVRLKDGNYEMAVSGVRACLAASNSL